MEPITKAPIKSINKTQIVQVISDRLDVTRILAARFLEVLVDIAGEALTRDRILIIPDLVQLTLCETKARTARKAKSFSGEDIVIPAKPASKKVAVKPIGQTKKISKS